jgi:hypothetical protein
VLSLGIGHVEHNTAIALLLLNALRFRSVKLSSPPIVDFSSLGRLQLFRVLH